MKKWLKKGLVGILVVGLGMSSIAFAVPEKVQEPGGDYLKGQAVVLYHAASSNDQSPLQGYSILKDYDFGSSINTVNGREKIALVSKTGFTTGQLIAALSSNHNVEIAEPNYTYQFFDTENTAPNDPFYEYQ